MPIPMLTSLLLMDQKLHAIKDSLEAQEYKNENVVTATLHKDLSNKDTSLCVQITSIKPNISFPNGGLYREVLL